VATPQLSVMLANYAAEDPGTWDHVLDQAEAADEAGVDRVVVPDHVAFGEHLEAYARPELGGSAGGRQPTGPDGYWLEPLTLLSAVAARTRRIRLGTGILLAALRRPIVLAKVAATLDALSGGRVDLGVGVGWQREEYEAAGLEFERRGELLDHTLEVLQTVWREPRATYADERLRFDGIHQMPKPRQPGGVPIWVSGRANRRVARRLARFGSGWIPWGDDAADVAAGMARMRPLVEEQGGSLDGIQVVGALAPVRRAGGGTDVVATMAAVPALADAGVTDFRLMLRVPPDRSAAVDRYAEAVAAFRAVAGVG
jgi:probable F420-dependent oxidoreductase